jgi:hypothetical protein
MKRPAAEKKKKTEAAEVLTASDLKTYIRSDAAVMAEIEAHCYLNAGLLALASGRGRTV